MMERIDMMFAAALQRWIVRELNGDGDLHQGQIRSLYTAQDMNSVVRTQGMITAYERVLAIMQEIAKEMNEPHERAPPNVMGRPN